MADDKGMYFKLFRASEQAINRLIAARRECEEWYIGEPELNRVSGSRANQESMEEK